ncbi:unnamed protein product [Nippostrongylus brasiliensis]|uniref:Secreted protein n=1 Tax=Nippostrongylus brasiliensis TaxID=27835 RepID=A0A0N4YNT7_NIPBR|nr:unnamed protein product [Nippostrongylus brasiliensis]
MVLCQVILDYLQKTLLIQPELQTVAGSVFRNFELLETVDHAVGRRLVYVTFKRKCCLPRRCDTPCNIFLCGFEKERAAQPSFHIP